MLVIEIPRTEIFDTVSNEFKYFGPVKIQLEHSLLSVSKWESKWCKPFFKKDHTDEELLDYVRCMTISQNIQPECYNLLTEKNMKEISDYMASPMTATWFSEDNKPPSREIITAEVIYYRMTLFNIPFECQKWHINRLLTLIRVCNENQSKPKKRSLSEIARERKALNDQRKKELNTTG